MERIKFRQQAEKVLDKLGHGYLEITFDRERLLYPAVLTIYDKDSNPLVEIETPTKQKIQEAVSNLINEGKLDNGI